MKNSPLLAVLLVVGCWDKTYSDTAIPDDTWQIPDDTWVSGDDSGRDDSGGGGDDTGGGGDDTGGGGNDDTGGPDVPGDDDGDGYNEEGGDCDDTHAGVHPGAEESCDTPYDDNCDGDTNDLDALDCTLYYADADADGYGQGEALCLCVPEGDYSATDDGDCNDLDIDVHPGATEHCDLVDEDCDGSIDEEAVDMNSWYADADGDGYGDASTLVWSCDSQPSGTSTDSSDCEDGDATAYPGSHATETPFDGVDQDCDGDDFCHDLDCDGYADVVYASFRRNTNYTTSSTLYFGDARGLTNGARTTLRTYGAIRTLVQDLDGDGYQDVVFANHYDGSSFATDSYVYWGSAAGYSSSDRTDLPTLGAYGLAAADFNQDGYTDLVFANFHNDSSYVVNSYVYWGGASGYSSSDRTELSTLGAWEVSAADLDLDGYPDLVFSNTGNDSSYAVDSVVYWASAAGFRASDRTDLPTVGSFSHTVGDFDGDGWPDLAFANFVDDSLDRTIDSRVYWGGASGYSTSNATDVATAGAYFVRAADLDSDGDDDLVFSNYYNNTNYNGPSAVLRGGARSFGSAETFATVGAFEPAFADLDGDGWIEIIMPQVGDVGTWATDSAILWGSSGAYSDSNRTELSTTASQGAAVADFDGDGWLDVAFAEYYDGSYTNDSEVYGGSSSGYGAASFSLSTVGAYAPPVVAGR